MSFQQVCDEGFDMLVTEEAAHRGHHIFIAFGNNGAGFNDRLQSMAQLMIDKLEENEASYPVSVETGKPVKPTW